MIKKHAIDKAYQASKIGLFGSLIVLIPFFIYALWCERSFYPEPINRVFDNVSFRVSGAAKSPPTVVLYHDGRKIFYSECSGIQQAICGSEEYWNNWHTARRVQAIEIKPSFGFIKSINIDVANGKVIEINNSDDLDILITQHRLDPWRAIYGLVSILALSAIFLVVLRIVKRNSFQGD